MNPIRVLVVDDSALVRAVLQRGLSQDPGIEVVGVAPDPFVARDKILDLKPDVLTLDVEMPRMDGVEFLSKLMPQWPIPVIMVSSLTERGARITLDAMEAGAVDVVTKPRAGLAEGLDSMMGELREKVKAASRVDVSSWKNRKPKRPAEVIRRPLGNSTDKVIAIGASTGGTEAIKDVVTRFPVDTPGVVIVQHMPAGFTRMFSERLNGLCEMDVKEAEDGDRVMAGRILVAPGANHLEVFRSGGEYRVKVFRGDLVNGHMPSVEVMMKSVAKDVGANAFGVMLTGMGADGADAMKMMRDKGARCVSQDEASSVVYGMPKEAWLRGGSEKQLPLDQIADVVLKMVAEKR